MPHNKAYNIQNETGRIALHPLTLAFGNKSLNTVYHDYHAAQSLYLVRIALLLATMLYLIFISLDYQLVPLAAPRLLWIRLAVTLYFILILALTFINVAKRYFQPLMASVVLVGGLSVISKLAVYEAASSFNYYASIILTLIYGHALLRLRFIYAALTTWTIIGIYEWYAVSSDVAPASVILNNTYFLISANVMGMFASYGLEYYMRTTFWQKRQLNEKSNALHAEHARKSRELKEARETQLAMLPRAAPDHKEYTFAVSMKTAAEMGGDYYDLHVAEDNTVTFAIGDATGHGAQASALVAAMKILFSNNAAEMDINAFLQKASTSIRRMGLRNQYMALAVGRLCSSRLEIVGAGLPAALLYRCASGTVEEISLKGLPLGGYGDYAYHNSIFHMEPDDTLLLMTDGFAEHFNDKGEMPGYEKAAELFSHSARLSPEAIINQFEQYAESWSDGHPQQDDMTFMVIRKR